MYKLGVIGLGTRIHKGVLPALAGYSSDFCITAAADPDHEKVRNNAKNNPVGYKENFPIYPNADEMLANEKIDILDICLPTYLHADFAVMAMEKGINVITEKPISLI